MKVQLQRAAVLPHVLPQSHHHRDSFTFLPSLPPDVLTRIFEFSSVSTIYGSLYRSCRAFRSVVNASPVFRSLAACCGVYVFDRRWDRYPIGSSHPADVTIPRQELEKVENSLKEKCAEEGLPMHLNTRTTASRTLLSDLSHFGVVTYNRQMYFFGGRSHDVRLRQVFKFDPIRKELVVLDDMLNARSAPAVAVWQHKAFVFGGFNGCDKEFHTFEVFDLLQDRWLTRREMDKQYPLRQQRCSEGTSANDNKVPLDERLFEMPFSVCEASATSDRCSYVYVVGGCKNRNQDDETFMSDVWIYQPDRDVWQCAPAMPEPRILGTAVYVPAAADNDNNSSGVLCYFGGDNGGDGRLETDLHFACPASDLLSDRQDAAPTSGGCASWTTVMSHPPTPPSSLNTSAVQCGSWIYVSGHSGVCWAIRAPDVAELKRAKNGEMKVVALPLRFKNRNAALLAALE